MTFQRETLEASAGDVIVLRVETMDDEGFIIAVGFELFVGGRFVRAFSALNDALAALDVEVGKGPRSPRGPRR